MAGRSALQRRIVAALIVESEARPLGGVVVESSGRLPDLSATIRPKGRASLSTINAAITPWRDAFAEQTSLP